MTAAALLRELGFGPGERVVVVHADDVGMCQATLPAFEELATSGLVSAGSLMVPCPWFPAAARLVRQRPRLDAGVHLTLTSEHPGYRWRPLSTRDPASGLVDAEGYLHATVEGLLEGASAEVVGTEIRAQLAAARAAGVDVSHLDAHMYAALAEPYLETFLEVAVEAGVVPVVWCSGEPEGLGKRAAPLLARLRAERGELAVPAADHLAFLPLGRPREGALEQAVAVFDALEPGLTHLICHPARDTPELRAITADQPGRTADAEVLADPRLAEHVRRAGIRVIGYRELREVMLRAV